MFRDCVSFEKIDLKNRKILEIKSDSFYVCTNLKQVLLPDTLKKIADFSNIECLNVVDLQGHRTELLKMEIEIVE